MSIVIEPVSVDLIDDFVYLLDGYIHQIMEIKPFCLRHDATDVYKKIENKEWVLWAILKGKMLLGIAITTISQYPKYSALDVVVVLEDHTLSAEVFDEGLEKLEMQAKLNGCKYVEIHGRKGWEKLLSEVGYNFSEIILTKEV